MILVTVYGNPIRRVATKSHEKAQKARETSRGTILGGEFY